MNHISIVSAGLLNLNFLSDMSCIKFGTNGLPAEIVPALYADFFLHKARPRT